MPRAPLGRPSAPRGRPSRVCAATPPVVALAAGHSHVAAARAHDVARSLHAEPPLPCLCRASKNEKQGRRRGRGGRREARELSPVAPLPKPPPPGEAREGPMPWTRPCTPAVARVAAPARMESRGGSQEEGEPSNREKIGACSTSLAGVGVKFFSLKFASQLPKTKIEAHFESCGWRCSKS